MRLPESRFVRVLFRYCMVMSERNAQVWAAIVNADVWMKMPLPNGRAFGGASEARTLLEACQPLCEKLGVAEVVGKMFTFYHEMECPGPEFFRNSSDGRTCSCAPSPFPFIPFKKYNPRQVPLNVFDSAWCRYI